MCGMGAQIFDHTFNEKIEIKHTKFTGTQLRFGPLLWSILDSITADITNGVQPFCK